MLWHIRGVRRLTRGRYVAGLAVRSVLLSLRYIRTALWAPLHIAYAWSTNVTSNDKLDLKTS